MKRKKLVGYDLDGTLADTRRDIVNGVKFMLKEMGKAELPDVEIEKLVGEGLSHLVAMAMAENDPKAVERGAKHLRRYYQDHLLDFTCLYPLARQTLEYFRDRIQIVVTNKPEPFTSRILTELGVMPFLKGVYTGEKGIPRKPDPAALLKVMNECNISPSEVLWIGDSVIDVQTGKNAGVETVVLRHGFASRTRIEDSQPDHMVNDFAEFLKLAAEKNW